MAKRGNIDAAVIATLDFDIQALFGRVTHYISS